MPSTNAKTPQHTSPRIDRRRALRSGGTLLGSAALLGASAHTAGAAHSPDTLELDVAIDGRTWRMIRAGEDGPALAGDSFIVLGSIFPGGSFDEDVAGPDGPGAVGRWICRGTFMVDLESGDVPLVSTTQHFVLGDGLSSSGGQPEAAPDAIVSVGFESGVEQVHRTLSGGYGSYAGANGAVLQAVQGTNETQLQLGPETAVPAANYRFTFTFAS